MRSTRKGFLVLFVVSCLSIHSVSAFAASVLDQQYVPDSYPTFTRISYMYNAAQTFTAGVSGKLTQIDLFISRDSNNYTFYDYANGYDLRVDVRPVDPTTGAPLYSNSSALGGVLVPWADIDITSLVGVWHNIDFGSANVSVTEGTDYAIVLSSGGSWGTQFYWYGGLSEIVDGQLVLPYSGHPSYRRDVVNSSNWMAPDTGIANGFKTYVEATPTPIPGALVLFGSGLVGLIGIGRRRFRK